MNSNVWLQAARQSNMMSQQNPLLLALYCWVGISNYEKCNPRLKWKMLNSQWSVSWAACIAISRHHRQNELLGIIQFKGCMRKPPAVEGTVLTRVTGFLLLWFLDQHHLPHCKGSAPTWPTAWGSPWGPRILAIWNIASKISCLINFAKPKPKDILLLDT